MILDKFNTNTWQEVCSDADILRVNPYYALVDTQDERLPLPQALLRTGMVGYEAWAFLRKWVQLQRADADGTERMRFCGLGIFIEP